MKCLVSAKSSAAGLAGQSSHADSERQTVLTMGDKAAKVASDNAVPRRSLSLIELTRHKLRHHTNGSLSPHRSLDVVCNILRRSIVFST